MSVSHATRASGSLASTASRTESEIWSATLSGWPSVTDSEVKRKLRAAIARARLADALPNGAGQPLLRLQEEDAGRRPAVRRAVDDQALQRLQIWADRRRNRL